MLTGKNVVVFGGTGSLGKLLTHRLLEGELGMPEKLLVVSRDEAKQYSMQLEFQEYKRSTDEIFYRNYQRRLQFHIGDIRDYASVRLALRDAHFVFNAAALKQVPACEYFPYEAVQTNITGPENIARAIRENNLPIQCVIGVSTDKACKPVNVMGMTKAIQERLLIRANLDCPSTRFLCVRYGNVLASRGSVVPLFQQQIKNGAPITVTSSEMTRFLLPLDRAVDTIVEAARSGGRGEIYVPKVSAVKIIELARCMTAGRDNSNSNPNPNPNPYPIEITGIRPGEKLHEMLISEEEANRTVIRGDYFVILPMLPELSSEKPEKLDQSFTRNGYDSRFNLLSPEQVEEFAKEQGLISPIDNHTNKIRSNKHRETAKL
jgi:FlaA1/EpsC-like NDP-sugar epimerase